MLIKNGQIEIKDLKTELDETRSKMKSLGNQVD